MTTFAAPPGGQESAFAGRPPAPPSANVTFHPIVDLGAGTVIAVTPSVPAGLAEHGSDADRAIVAARTLDRLETRLPVNLVLRMATACGPEMDRLHQALIGLGRRPGGVILSVTGGFDGMPGEEAVARVGRLRKAGYLVGLDGTGDLPTWFLAEVSPTMVTLAPEVSRRAAVDPRRSALAEACVALARRVGGHVLAPGLISDDQLDHLRRLGVRLAQGPLLAQSGWRPGTPVSVPVGSGDTGPDLLGPRVTEFMMPATLMPETATAEQVLSAFNAEPDTTSVVLVDDAQRPRHAVNRTRFLLRLAGAYGHALHAGKPAARLADEPKTVPRTVPAIAALRAAGDDPARVYDDLVVVDEVGRCLGVARVGDLIRSVSALERR